MNLPSLLGHTFELCHLIERNAQPADKLVSEFLRDRRYLGARDRRFITETVFGILRHRRLIEALLEQYISENESTSDLDARHVRYLPLYISYMLAVKDQGTDDLIGFRSDPHGSERDLVPSRATEGTGRTISAQWKTYFPKISLPQYVQWVTVNKNLQFLSADPKDPSDRIIQLGVQYSFQDWMVKDWMDQFADETEDLLRALNVPADTVLRVNLLRAAREDVQQRLRGEGIETVPAKLSPAGLVSVKRFNRNASAAFREGLFEVQDEGSQLVSLLASPQPGTTVIDACAGTGGKTLHLAELMHDTGEIVAFDIDDRRLDELKKRADRAGYRSIRIVRQKEFLPENYFGKAQLVLVDAPCSGVGTIRRNPGLKWSVSESLVEHYAELQMEILHRNAGFVAPGGRLVYATCSVLRRENEDIIERFLSGHANFEPVSPPQLPAALASEHATNSRYVHLLPHRHGTDGFFLTILIRKEYID